MTSGGNARPRFSDYPRVRHFSDRLVSPAFSTQFFGEMSVRFRTSFQSYTGENADPPVTLSLLASTNDGVDWFPLPWSHSEVEGDLPVDFVRLDFIEDIAGFETVRLAFEVTGGDSSTIVFWEIDDVTVAGE